MAALSPVLSILAGLILLFTGRKVVWLAASLAVFLAIYQWFERILGTGWLSLVIAVILGLVVAGFAIRFIKLIGYLIGALAGAVALPYLLGLFGVHGSGWILALIGAVVGIIAVSLAFDWGLIIMTAWMGSNVVANSAIQLFHLSASLEPVIFFILLVGGILVQFGQWGGKHR